MICASYRKPTVPVTFKKPQNILLTTGLFDYFDSKIVLNFIKFFREEGNGTKIYSKTLTVNSPFT